MNKKLLDQVINGVILGLVFLLPLFFLPITTNYYDFNKQALLLIGVCALIVLWSLRVISTKSVKLRITPFDLPVLLIAVAYIVSTVWQSTNKFETIFQAGSTGTIVLLTFFYFFIVNNIDTRAEIKKIYWALVASASLLSFIAVWQFVGLGETLIPQGQGLDYLRLKFWTPAGGLLPIISYLLLVLPVLALRFYPVFKAEGPKKPTDLLLDGGSLILIGFGLATSGYQLLTTAKPVLLSQNTGWQIAIETLKVSPLFGVGPTNFITAFTQFKPIAFNNSTLWSVWFQASSNHYFHLLTTVGLLGLLSFLLLVLKVLRTNLTLLKQKAQENELQKPLFVSFLVALVLLALMPSNFLMVFAFYTVVALLASLSVKKEYVENSHILPWVLSLPLFLLVGLSLFSYRQVYLAEYQFKQSVDALAKNDGTKAYDLQIKAIALNPNQASYRTAYSQTNFALANALAQKQDLNDQDRQNISILIQQAIREAKAAVALSPQNIATWENLALTYRSLINFAQGADSWTVAAYNQAIALDPYNPNLRLALGGVYFSLKQYDEAVKFFEQTVTLKPDMANGYYNLAAAYKERGDYEKAALAMENVLKIIQIDSEDGKRAQAELDALKQKVAEKAQKEATKPGEQPSEELTKPEPLPTGIKPPIALPTESGPEITPTPTAEPTVAPTPTVTP